MSKDPIGLLARLNALSLMLITPEYYTVRRLRSKRASQKDAKPTDFAIKPEQMQLDGLTIRFARGGVADRPTVLFLSPLPQSILCYDAVWSNLATEASLIALDLPGFGRSQGGMDYMNFQSQSTFLEKFVSALNLSDFHIVAPDVGMPVALHYVIHRKHKAKSILIGDGPSVLPSSDGSLVRKMVGSGFWRTMIRLTGARTFISGGNALGYLHYKPNVLELEDYVASYAGRLSQVTNWFKGYPAGLKEIDPHLETLDLPVQIFWGDQDAFLTTKNAEQLHARLPKSALTVFERCGHFCYQDKSEDFTQLVRKWISGGHQLQ